MKQLLSILYITSLYITPDIGYPNLITKVTVDVILNLINLALNLVHFFLMSFNGFVGAGQGRL